MLAGAAYDWCVAQLRLDQKTEPAAVEKVGSGADPVVYEKLRCLPVVPACCHINW